MHAMKLAILALAALTTTAFAVEWPPYYDVQSAGFRLQLLSADRRLNGAMLGACHQGAAQEGLCPTTDDINNASRPYTTFYHNVSSSTGSLANADDRSGVLGWTLNVGTKDSTEGIPSAMSFRYYPETNLADITFLPGYDRYTEVFFEAGSDRMYVDGMYDDLVSPPTNYISRRKLLTWYVCLTRYHYLFETLAWKVGAGATDGATNEPQNPNCQAVGVKRVWV